MVKQRVEFGKELSLGRVRLKGGLIGHSFEFRAPNVGDACVCCGAGTGGRTKSYHASTQQVWVPPVPMPVCEDGHACADRTTTLLQLTLIGLGGVIAATFGLSEL
jgi:hypothetical protein